jgi:hypothetical protein
VSDGSFDLGVRRRLLADLGDESSLICGIASEADDLASAA